MLTLTGAALSLGGVCRACEDGKRLPLEPGGDPKRGDWEGGMVSMGVTSVSEEGWGAGSPDVQGEGLVWRADRMSWLVGGRDRESDTEGGSGG